MKSVKNKTDHTISIRMYGRVFELPAGHHWTEMDFWGGEEDLRFVAIKMKDCFEFEGDWPEEIECPCCGAKVKIKEEKKEITEEKPKTKRKVKK